MNFGKIEKQGYSCLRIPNNILAGKDAPRFNGSIIDFNGSILFAYRCYSTKHGRSCIGLTRFNKPSFIAAVKACDPNLLKVEDSREMNLYAKCRNTSILEDPRLCEHNGSLYISYVELLTGKGWHPSIRCCKLTEDLKVEHVIPMDHGQNERGIEKNWVFFSHMEKLHFIYDVHIHNVFQVNDKTGLEENQHHSKYIHWIWGWMRGGATPIRINEDEYMSFMHSSDYQAWKGRKYSMTPYCFSAKAPHEITRLWDEPVLLGTGDEYFCGAGTHMV